MSGRYKKNFHIAKQCSMKTINKMIKNYPKQYPIPKYLQFMKAMKIAGYKIRIYEAGVSKYIFTFGKGEANDIIKIRFSNHKPLLYKEREEDCDYYVGISNMQVSTTDQIIKQIIK